MPPSPRSRGSSFPHTTPHPLEPGGPGLDLLGQSQRVPYHTSGYEIQEIGYLWEEAFIFHKPCTAVGEHEPC